MPASPIHRLEFEDGSTVDLAGNLWVYRTDRKRFGPVSMLPVGTEIQPDYPDDRPRRITKKTVLPYKNRST